MREADHSPEAADEYNLLGQRIGSKGRRVRDQLLDAARLLMKAAPTTIPTLTAITSATDVRVSIVYRYYPDVGALLIDAMRPLREEMAPVTALLEKRWPAGSEYEDALAFAHAHFQYWNARMGALFVRNSLAERGDVRFINLRTQWALPLFHALAAKFADAHGRSEADLDLPMAGIVISGMERTTTLSLQRIVLEADVVTPGRGRALAQAAKQRVAVAQLITTLLQHDYLQR